MIRKWLKYVKKMRNIDVPKWLNGNYGSGKLTLKNWKKIKRINK